MVPKVERIPEIPILVLGEAPHWDEATQSLYFVDIFGKSINKYVPSTGQHTKAEVEKPISMIIPVKDKINQFIVSMQREISIITWDGLSEKISKQEKVIELEKETQNILNDAKVDAKGRLWIGSLGPSDEYTENKIGRGSLYSLDKEIVSTHVTNIGCSNGLACDNQLKQFYFVDTFKGTVSAYDFDLEKGSLSNGRVIFSPNKHKLEGSPDGITIDVDGNLWVALFAGHSILKIDPRRPETLLQKVEIPAKQVTSLAWGGVNLDELYVTTGSWIIDGEELPPPNNGATYRVTGLGTRGLTAEKFVF